MENWVVHEVRAHVRVLVTRTMPKLPPALEKEVELVWQGECKERPRMFNGLVFSADEITPEVITGHWTEFRRNVAQIKRPELYDELHVRSLAVNGIIRCREGVLIGRRSSYAVYQAAQWQLPPAGSVDPGAQAADGSIDFRIQLLAELQEELGLPAERIEAMVPLCLVEHPRTHVTDFGIELRTDADAATLLDAHVASGNGEYEEMHVLPISQILSLGPDLMPTVPVFLARLRSREPESGDEPSEESSFTG